MMVKAKLSQAEFDKIVVVERMDAKPTVCTYGVNDIAFQVSGVAGGCWQYRAWKHMLQRCFDARRKVINPTYRDVTCCDEWLSFANFLEWCNKEVDYSGKPEGMDLDKDIIIMGNKQYSPEACSFVPRDVNVLLTDHRAARGEYPQGVNYHKSTGKFVVQLSVDGKQKHLGLFLTPEDAFAAYKIAKEAQIKVVALRYKDVLKPAVFESLMNWSIEP